MSTLSEKYILYMDILGAKEIMKSNDQTSLENLVSLLSSINEAVNNFV